MKTDKLKLVRYDVKEYWPLLLCAFYIMMMWLDNLPKLNELSIFQEFQLLLNYKIGFIQRGFIGTFLLPVKYFTPVHYEIIFAVITLIYIVTYAAFCIWIFNGYLDKKVSGYWILLVTFLPMTVGNVFKAPHYGRTDNLMAAALLINAWLLTTKKRGALLISTVIVTIAMLIHSLYAFLFFAGTFDLLIWLWWKTKNKNYLTAAVVDTIIVIVLLFYFNNGRPLLFMPYEKIADYIAGRTSENMADYVLSLVPLWFSSSSGEILNASKQSFFYFTVHETIIFYVLMLPVITWIFEFWRRSYKRFGNPKIFWLFAFSIIPMLIVHIYQADHGRTMAGAFLSQLILMFSVLNYDASNEEREIFTEIFYEKSETYRSGLLIYLLILGPIDIITPNRSLHRILLAVKTVLKKLFAII